MITAEAQQICASKPLTLVHSERDLSQDDPTVMSRVAKSVRSIVCAAGVTVAGMTVGGVVGFGAAGAVDVATNLLETHQNPMAHDASSAMEVPYMTFGALGTAAGYVITATAVMMQAVHTDRATK